MQRQFLLLLMILSSCLANLSQAQEHSPLQVNNQSPLANIFGLPVAESARVLLPGQETSHLSLDWASNFTNEYSSNELVYIDGESAQLNIRWRTGLDLWEFGVDVKYARFSGGSLDSFIENWHDWFSLPNGGRETAAQNQLRYAYIRDGLTQLNILENHSGFGDTRLTGAYQIPNDSRFNLAIRGGLKLPTGDSNKLLGSGGTDFNIGLNLEDSQTLMNYQATYFAAAGILWTQDGDILSDQRKNSVFYSHLGIIRELTPRWQLKLQMDTHTAFYDSVLAPLGEALQLSFGASFRLTNDLKLDLAIVEDATTDSSSDVNFHISLYNYFR